MATTKTQSAAYFRKLLFFTFPPLMFFVTLHVKVTTPNPTLMQDKNAYLAPKDSQPPIINFYLIQ